MGASRSRRWVEAYGASGWHLALMVLSFATAAYVVHTVGLSSLWNTEVWWQSIAVWFLAAVILHDLVLFPAYALLDGLLRRGLSRPDGSGPRPPAAMINHVRLPTLASGLLLLMFFPGIMRRGGDTYARATGLDQDPFLGRWLALCAAAYLISGLVWVVRLGAARSRSREVPGPGAPTR